MISGIINTQTKRSFLSKHKRCSCCNAKASTIDHIIPCQVFEMTVEFEDDFRKCVRDRSNWRPMCKPCNSRRKAYLDINEIPIHLREHYQNELDTYIKARHEVLESQNYKCAKCGTELSEVNGVLLYKRKATNRELNSKNCIVICYNCDEVKHKD